jgi:hypothetical protein
MITITANTAKPAHHVHLRDGSSGLPMTGEADGLLTPGTLLDPRPMFSTIAPESASTSTRARDLARVAHRAPNPRLSIISDKRTGYASNSHACLSPTTTVGGSPPKRVLPGRELLAQVATIVTPETILAWHRKLVGRTMTAGRRSPGRPRASRDLPPSSSRWSRTTRAGATIALSQTPSNAPLAPIKRDHRRSLVTAAKGSASCSRTTACVSYLMASALIVVGTRDESLR